MKVYTNLLFASALFLLLFSCSAPKEEVEYRKATQELITLLDNDPALIALLESSIQKAKEINPDPNTNPAQSLDEYFEFVSWAETTMPWAVSKKDEYPEIFDHIFQSFGAFYFLIDQPLPQLEGKGLVTTLKIHLKAPIMTLL